MCKFAGVGGGGVAVQLITDYFFSCHQNICFWRGGGAGGSCQYPSGAVTATWLSRWGPGPQPLPPTHVLKYLNFKYCCTIIFIKFLVSSILNLSSDVKLLKKKEIMHACPIHHA